MFFSDHIYSPSLNYVFFLFPLRINLEQFLLLSFLLTTSSCVFYLSRSCSLAFLHKSHSRQEPPPTPSVPQGITQSQETLNSQHTHSTPSSSLPSFIETAHPFHTVTSPRPIFPYIKDCPNPERNWLGSYSSTYSAFSNVSTANSTI